MAVKSPPKTIEWIGGLEGYVRMIDQTKLPAKLVMLEVYDEPAMWEAIRTMRIRGAPAIGIAAAMGAVLAIRADPSPDCDGVRARLEEACNHLATARPTAVNLSWALERMRTRVRSMPCADVDSLKLGLLAEAKRIRDEDSAMCRAIGEHGESLIEEGAGILTHCNAGALATAELGTALAPIYVAHEQGRSFRVYTGETRPLLQGSRLTTWELRRAGIDVTLLCDSMVGALMAQGLVTLVITGADRIAANGDVANKIGTYTVAVLAQRHGIPFYIAAPSSTFDLAIADGSQIPIEERDPDEIRRGFGRLTAPPDVPCFCPAFDVTPAELICGIVTERGMICPVSRKSLAATLRG